MANSDWTVTQWWAIIVKPNSYMLLLMYCSFTASAKAKASTWPARPRPSPRPRRNITVRCVTACSICRWGILFSYLHLLTYVHLFVTNFLTSICWTVSQSDQNLRGPHIVRQQQLSIDSPICCKPSPDLSSKPAGRRCCCRPMGQTDGKMNGRALDRFMTLTAYCTDREKNATVALVVNHNVLNGRATGGVRTQ